MLYKVIIMPEAIGDLQRLAKSEPKAFAKAERFIKELEEHPKTGTGHPEPLKGKPENRWSREITKNIAWCTAFLKPRFMWKFSPHTDTTTTNNYTSHRHRNQ